jgi:tetratricopeptide (TPR) repeat protein
VNLFERASACVGTDLRMTAELSRLRGAALFDLGRFEEARSVLTEGLLASRSSGDQAVQWRLELELVELDIYTRPGERPASETQRLAERAIAALTRLGDQGGLARANRLLGEALTLQGRLDDGIAAFEEGARLAHEIGDEREIALPQQLMALHGSTPLQAFITQCEQMIAIRGRRPRPEVVMRLAYARALSGDEAGARGDLREGLDLAGDVGGSFRVADAELYAGLTTLALGEPGDAAAFLSRSAERLTGIGESNLRSTVEGFLGEALWRVGRLNEAAEAAARCRQLAAEDDWASQMLWRQVEAKVLADHGDLAAAVDLMSEAAAIADQTDFLGMAAAVHLDAARLTEAAGESSVAGHERELARHLMSRKPARPPPPRFRRSLMPVSQP